MCLSHVAQILEREENIGNVEMKSGHWQTPHGVQPKPTGSCL